MPSICFANINLHYLCRMSQEDAAQRSAADAAASNARVAALERQLSDLQRAGAEREAALAQARAQLVHSEDRLRELEDEGPRAHAQEQVGSPFSCRSLVHGGLV